MMKLELVRESVVVNVVIGRDAKIFLTVIYADSLVALGPHFGLRSAVNFREARADKPRRGAADKAELQSQAHAGPRVEIGQDEARDSNNFQDAIERDGLRQLFKDTLHTDSAHDESLSRRSMSKMHSAPPSPLGPRFPCPRAPKQPNHA